MAKSIESSLRYRILSELLGSKDLLRAYLGELLSTVEVTASHLLLDSVTDSVTDLVYYPFLMYIYRL
jgi:hypothetical protein